MHKKAKQVGTIGYGQRNKMQLIYARRYDVHTAYKEEKQRIPMQNAPAHDENLNLAGSIGHEAERYASILLDRGQFNAGGKTRGRCSGRERE